MPIIWRDSMAIGHSTIDSEHKYLFCLINAVELALKIDDADSVVGFYLDQLIDYTRAHFDNEEKIQLRIRYPQYADHKQEHQEILAELNALRERIAAAATQEADTASAEETAAEEATDTDGLGEEEPHASAELPPGEIEDYDPYAAPAEAPTDAHEPEAKPAMAERSHAEVVAFLRHWILDHVLQSDLKLKPYLQAARKGG